MNFSRFITSPSAERPLSSVEASLCCGKVCQKGKESAHPFHLPPRAFSFFFRFDYCYFYRNTQREPLRRREAAGSETGRRISFGSLQLEKTAEIQPTRAIAQALSEHVETFLSSTVEKCFSLAENWMKY